MPKTTSRSPASVKDWGVVREDKLLSKTWTMAASTLHKASESIAIFECVTRRAVNDDLDIFWQQCSLILAPSIFLKSYAPEFTIFNLINSTFSPDWHDRATIFAKDSDPHVPVYILTRSIRYRIRWQPTSWTEPLSYNPAFLSQNNPVGSALCMPVRDI